jgi:hypothetical protein
MNTTFTLDTKAATGLFAALFGLLSTNGILVLPVLPIFWQHVGAAIIGLAGIILTFLSGAPQVVSYHTSSASAPAPHAQAQSSASVT